MKDKSGRVVTKEEGKEGEARDKTVGESNEGGWKEERRGLRWKENEERNKRDGKA